MVKEIIFEGVYVNFQVKYGYICFINIQVDFCKEIKNVDFDCLIEKGKIFIIKFVDFFKEILFVCFLLLLFFFIIIIIIYVDY